MGLYQEFTKEKVGRLALRQLVAARRDTKVGEVIERLREAKLACAAIVDDEGKPVGVFTERILVVRLAEGSISMDDAVVEHLDERWAKVREDEPIRNVLRGIVENRTRFVCVTDASGKAIAMTGQKGLMECIAEYCPSHVQTRALRASDNHHAEPREGA